MFLFELFLLVLNILKFFFFCKDFGGFRNRNFVKIFFKFLVVSLILLDFFFKYFILFKMFWLFFIVVEYFVLMNVCFCCIMFFVDVDIFLGKEMSLLRFIFL